MVAKTKKSRGQSLLDNYMSQCSGESGQSNSFTAARSFDVGDAVPSIVSRSKLTKKIVKELAEMATIEEIEGAVVYLFLRKHFNNQFQNNYLKDVSCKFSSLVVDYCDNNRISFDLLDVECIFELLVPPQEKQLNGAVYTPPEIVNYIVNSTIDRPGTVCDCSCGAGAFLLGAISRLQALEKISVCDIIETRLFSVDISESSVRRCKIMLTLYALLAGEDKSELKYNIVAADSLNDDWRSIFPQCNSFDFIVGNPPYVRIQDLKDNSKGRLIRKWQTTGEGNYNLYFAFFELGVQLLKPDGRLGYITPNNYFTSLSGEKLREYLSSKRLIARILNFNHLKIFDAAQTYTCITFLHKNVHTDTFDYYYLEDEKLLHNLRAIKYGVCQYSKLDSRKWRLMTQTEFDNISKLESTGTPLGKLCKIRVGIATLKDTVFFVEETDENYCTSTHPASARSIEKKITRKVVKISSISKEEEIALDKRRIIFPYKQVGAKYELYSEDELRTEYPLCYAHLNSLREELEARDKGKKNYPAWYAWGRTQGMGFKGQRLYTKTFSSKPNFMLDLSEDTLFCNGYAVFCDAHIRGLQRILNSQVFSYYIKRTSVEIEGNFQCYQKNFIERFSIPELNDREWNYLETEESDDVVDDWLIKKYDLSM